MTISLCMIIKDESENLRGCLNSVKDFVDEIIIVDTGSIDGTISIAKEFTDKIYNFNWCDDFSKARNFSLSKATKKWILVLDADEQISKEDLKKLNDLILNNEVMGYKFVQRNYSNKKTKIKWKNSENDTYKESNSFLGWQYRGIIRLFKNDKRIKFIYPIHETVLENIKKLEGKITNSGIPIHHFLNNKRKDELYYNLLKKKVNKFPMAHSFAELALHCFQIGKKQEGEKYRKEAIKLNKDMEFLSKIK